MSVAYLHEIHYVTPISSRILKIVGISSNNARNQELELSGKPNEINQLTKFTRHPTLRGNANYGNGALVDDAIAARVRISHVESSSVHPTINVANNFVIISGCSF